MDYPVASLVAVVSAVLVLSYGQTDTQTDRQIDTQTDADERFTPATLVGVSKYHGISSGCLAYW